jgi:sugar phosphate isomerase/epimerase
MVGVHVGDLRQPVKDGIRRAAELGLRFVELPTEIGELVPENLSGTGRRHLARYIEDFGLRISSLSADIPQSPWTDGRSVERRIEQTKGILTLAADLGVRVVTFSAGGMHSPGSDSISPIAMEGLCVLGDQADRLGIHLAMRPTLDGADSVAALLEHLRCPAFKLGLDPAAIVAGGTNPMSIIERLANEVVLVHARDATIGRPEHPGREVRLGEGDVDLVGVVAGLAAAGFQGPHILRRTDSASPESDIIAGRDALRKLLRSA